MKDVLDQVKSGISVLLFVSVLNMVLLIGLLVQR